MADVLRCQCKDTAPDKSIWVFPTHLSRNPVGYVELLERIEIESGMLQLNETIVKALRGWGIAKDGLGLIVPLE